MYQVSFSFTFFFFVFFVHLFLFKNLLLNLYDPHWVLRIQWWMVNLSSFVRRWTRYGQKMETKHFSQQIHELKWWATFCTPKVFFSFFWEAIVLHCGYELGGQYKNCNEQYKWFKIYIIMPLSSSKPPEQSSAVQTPKHQPSVDHFHNLG